VSAQLVVRTRSGRVRGSGGQGRSEKLGHARPAGRERWWKGKEKTPVGKRGLEWARVYIDRAALQAGAEQRGAGGGGGGVDGSEQAR
jgi:hypothetical protein